MIRLDKAFRTTRVMRSLTGLDLLKFNDLLAVFTLVLENQAKRILKQLIEKEEEDVIIHC